MKIYDGSTWQDAKSLKIYIEPIITKSKKDSTHNRRIVFSYLKNKTKDMPAAKIIIPTISIILIFSLNKNLDDK